ncbi:MAG: hypothetical protein AB8B67_03350 [Rickettsiaceae bacterium]
MKSGYSNNMHEKIIARHFNELIIPFGERIAANQILCTGCITFKACLYIEPGCTLIISSTNYQRPDLIYNNGIEQYFYRIRDLYDESKVQKIYKLPHGTFIGNNTVIGSDQKYYNLIGNDDRALDESEIYSRFFESPLRNTSVAYIHYSNISKQLKDDIILVNRGLLNQEQEELIKSHPLYIDKSIDDNSNVVKSDKITTIPDITIPPDDDINILGENDLI